jgi:hypothetical protein
MSRSLDLFIDTDLDLDQLAKQLGDAAGVDLSRSGDGRTWILRDGSVVAELGPHPYEDDGDLLLSQYHYSVSARVPTDARPQETSEAAVLRKLAQRLRAATPWRVLLVLDLQYRDGDPGTLPPSISSAAPDSPPAGAAAAAGGGAAAAAAGGGAVAAGGGAGVGADAS